ncbi:MAG: YtxH domain-containing protein [Candidatus Eiseniibacteriota bacterium]
MSDNRTDALLAFLFGAVVGAGVALLVAPASGTETRKRLGDAAKKLGHDVDEKLAHAKDSIQARAGDVRGAIQAGRDAYQKARHGEEPAPTSTAM